MRKEQKEEIEYKNQWVKKKKENLLPWLYQPKGAYIYMYHMYVNEVV